MSVLVDVNRAAAENGMSISSWDNSEFGRDFIFSHLWKREQVEGRCLNSM